MHCPEDRACQILRAWHSWDVPAIWTDVEATGRCAASVSLDRGQAERTLTTVASGPQVVRITFLKRHKC